MGLKNKLSQMKNFLFDDGEDEEKPSKKTFKKPIIKKVKEEVEEETYVEIPKSKEIEDFFIEDVSEKEEISEPRLRVQKQEKEFQFPEFNDDDFMVNSKPEPIITKVEEVRPALYQGSKKRKEEVKRFKPSPIISPIYGLLDNDGNKIAEEEKKEILAKDSNEINIDDVRKKAYGNLDDELEDTMKRLSQKTIEEAEADMEDEEKEEIKELSRSKKASVIEEETVIKKEIVSDDNEDDDDDMILPNVNFKEIDIDVERTKKKEDSSKIKEEEKKSKVIDEDDDDDDDDTKEQDLFNLIDTMYQEGKDE